MIISKDSTSKGLSSKEPTSEQSMPERPTSNPMEDGIVHHQHMVCSYRRLAELPNDHELATVSEQNEWFLRSISALNELAPEISEEHQDLAPEIARLELKMNLLIELVGQTLGRQLDLPPPVDVALTCSGIEWYCAEELPLESAVEISLYLQPELPRAVTLFGTVFQCKGGKVVVSFRGMSQSTEDWLAKFIFRHHRRQVAHTKIASS